MSSHRSQFAKTLPCDVMAKAQGTDSSTGSCEATHDGIFTSLPILPITEGCHKK